MSDGTAKAQVEHVILAPDVLCENAATLVRPHERAARRVRNRPAGIRAAARGCEPGGVVMTEWAAHWHDRATDCGAEVVYSPASQGHRYDEPRP
jgi:hypothetical protein